MSFKENERSHEKCRQIHCAGCGKKDLKCFAVTSTIAEILKAEVFHCYDVANASYPTGVCGPCRNNLFIAKRGGIVPSSVHDRWNSLDYEQFRQPPRSGPCPSSCSLCKSGKFAAKSVEQKKQPDLPRLKTISEEGEEVEASISI